MSTSIEEILKTIEIISKELKEQENKVKKLPGRANLIEIMNRNHLENANSDVLAFLLSPDEDHHHPEYGSIFLKEMQSIGLKINSTDIERVQREQSTDDSRRIDIFIHTKADLIIIENKIRAKDQEQQIHDYLDWAKRLYGTKTTNNVVIIYLTLDGKNPSEDSISKDELNKLKEEKLYIPLSYGDLIDIWLSQLSTRANNEQILQAAIIQYIDLIKGLTDRRGEISMDETNIRKMLFNKYDESNRNDLIDSLRSIDLYKEGILLSAYIKFLVEIKEAIFKKENNLKDKIFFYRKEQKYKLENEKQWIDSILTNPFHFGIGCELPNIEGTYSVIHFTNGTETTQLLNGILLDSENKDIKNIISEKRSDLKLTHESSELNSFGIVACDNYSSWALGALLHTTEWENKSTLSLPEHAVEHWIKYSIRSLTISD